MIDKRKTIILNEFILENYKQTFLFNTVPFTKLLGFKNWVCGILGQIVFDLKL